ncbi:NAD(P)-dependent oxidoreductase [Paraburkholderia sp. BR10923]|uniref:NAD(P)-dependent oxidoreductase n=1 Tax=Paraburkholderia sp. BR10923 TaxID=3236992 RepID=UPI0034CD2FE5
MIKVGYIGLGALGSQLARRFIGSAELWVWDISAEARVAFSDEAGVHVAKSAAELAENCQTIIVCLPRSSDVRDMIFGETGLSIGLSRGSLLIDQTSGVPEETRQIANELQKCDITFVDAAVSASPHMVPLGGATLMVGGADEAFERAKPVLKLITETIYRCGTLVGDGQAMKIVNNAMNAACRLGTLEVAVLGRKAGIPLRELAVFLNKGVARNQTTDKMLPALVEGKTSTNFALALMLKDVNQALSLGMAVGTPMYVTTIVRGLLQIGANTLPSKARLEDMVRVIEMLAGTQLGSRLQEATGDQSRACTGEATASVGTGKPSLEDLLESAIAALCLHITYECAMMGLKYGLSMRAISNVINTSSGWSECSRTLLPALAEGVPIKDTKLKESVRDLNQICSLSIRLGAPLLIANAVRNIWEHALNTADPDDLTPVLTVFYHNMSAAVQFAV